MVSEMKGVDLVVGEGESLNSIESAVCVNHHPQSLAF